MASVIPIVLSRWHHHFQNLQFSTQEFYSTVEELLKSKEIPKVSYERITLSQGGFFSTKREYLRVTRKELVFDICAAPFGSGFFVSWWHGNSVGPLLELVYRIPWIGSYVANRATLKTYYQLDTENMFKESVRGTVLEAIDKVTTARGMRALSDNERVAMNSK